MRLVGGGVGWRGGPCGSCWGGWRGRVNGPYEATEVVVMMGADGGGGGGAVAAGGGDTLGAGPPMRAP